MARSHFVKKAQKDYPQHGIKKGESYYWWKFMVGGRGGPKQFSKTAPRASQLTQSEFLAQVYDLNDEIGAIVPPPNMDDAIGDLESIRDDLVSRINELGEEQQSKLDNMPDGLQQGSSGELLQNRIDECQSWASELEGVDISLDDEEKPERESDDTDEEYAERVEQWEEERSDKIDEIISELQDCTYNGE